MDSIKGFLKIFKLFDKREKRNSAVLFGLIVFGALVETLGVGIILPFVTVVLQPEIFEKYSFLKAIYNLSFIGTYQRFVILMCIALIIIFVFKGLYMFFLLYMQNRFTLNRQIVMAKRLLESYMNKPYEFFFSKNSVELQRNVNSIVPSLINGLLLPGLSFLTELLIVAFILVLLLVADPFSAVSIAVILGGFGWLFYFLIKGHLSLAAKRLNEHFYEMGKSVLEGIGSIKEIKVMGREKSFISFYNENSKGYAKNQAFYNLAGQAPRLIIESLAVCGIVIIILVNVLYGKDMNQVLPVLALFAMAAIRIMPSMNRILGYATSIRFNLVNLNEIYEDVLEAVSNDAERTRGKKTENCHYRKFSNDIIIKNLTYRYPNTDVNILEQASVTIKKGQSIGIIGPSGAGKTTLIDLLLGLLPPTAGCIMVDGDDIRDHMGDWQRNLGYVPQKIYLTDDTILRNVAFGIEEKEIDEERVWSALEAAQMKIFVENLPKKVYTNIGESGIFLSGGQRQRLGIARALYHNPEVLILDEATSALDTEVEKLISEALNTIGKNKTLIIIAHRINTLDQCDLIYKVDGGKITCTNIKQH
jgi:ABC-type multidrug transport system fused ATPase/permease subunit